MAFGAAALVGDFKTFCMVCFDAIVFKELGVVVGQGMVFSTTARDMILLDIKGALVCRFR